MALDVEKINATRPGKKPIKLYDAKGLFLLVNPNDTRWWRFRYKVKGREKLISLGTYPDVNITDARKKCKAARRQLDDGIDPSAKRKAERSSNALTFKAVAEEWLERQKDLSADTIDQFRARLENHLYPKLANHAIDAISAPDLLATLRRIEVQGRHETAHRARALGGRIFRYAIATGRAERDPSGDLKGALTPVRGSHHATVTEPARVGELLDAIQGYAGHSTTYGALRLAPLVFVRPGELRAAEWKEINLKAAEWRIPAERMKMDEAHIVPLSRQAVAILQEMKNLTGDGRYVFPSIRTDERPMSENTVNSALRRLGYTTEEMTGHGFRTIASTLLNEKGHHPDVIELQLAHAERNKVRAAYNHASRLAERRTMMQEWADHLDQLRAAAAKEAQSRAQ
jgi:integrase